MYQIPCTALRRFCRDDSGAVMTDWVLLIALTIMMAVGLVTSVGNVTKEVAVNTYEEIGAIVIE